MRWPPGWPPACRLQKYRFRSKDDGEALTHCRLHGGHGSLHVFAAGAAVNLEHAATPSTLLGGHVVQGHVDAVGDVLAVSQAGGEWRTRIAAPAAVAPHLVERGSVAVDGVSLTVAAVGAGWFEVALIPATLAKTTLRARLAGSRVNLEADAMSKLVAEHVRRALAAAGRAV